MPTKARHLRYVAHAAREAALARQERDVTIAAAHADGVPLRAIADAAGLTFQRVHQIVQAERDVIGAPSVS